MDTSSNLPPRQLSGLWQRPQRGKFGTVGRNEIVGPSFSQMDMSFFKNFAITEQHLLQFRAEAFNFLNHTNLANPNPCVDCPEPRRAHLRGVCELRAALMAVRVEISILTKRD
jgi:hypothetical protein